MKPRVDRLAKIIADAGRVSPRMLAAKILSAGYVYDAIAEEQLLNAMAEQIRRLLKEV